MADTVSGDSRGGWTNEYDPEAVFYYGGGKRPDIVNSVFVITLAVRATRICTQRKLTLNAKATLKAQIFPLHCISVLCYV
ncbi:hypothetical protein DXW21_24760 [Salmonella enterica]|nr:hypothetical protein [Salmonella enterica]ECC3903331.1 hypothetical protein [Salmonella enterica subsp. enterica]EAN3060427.1 hypothetical protein [Salmonella enterica]EAP3040256.1 hypothetical protein [Salmonella enterica]EAP3911849.1 hypothetical protein [Salmonella enterica]